MGDKTTRRQFIRRTSIVGLAGFTGYVGQGGAVSRSQRSKTAQTKTTMYGTQTTGGSSEKAPYIVVHDIVVGAESTPAVTPPCQPQSLFAPGQQVVWRIKVIDPQTGNPVKPNRLKSVQVRFKSGKTFDAQYFPHGEGGATDKYWTATWTIPKDYPAGPVNYSIVVQDSRPSKEVTFNVGPLLTIVKSKSTKMANGTS